MKTFVHKPGGYFNLLNQSRFFQQCAAIGCNADKAILTFPVDGFTSEYATVTVTQPQNNELHFMVQANEVATHAAYTQALAVFSLDTDDSGWAEVGERDVFIGKLQKQYDYVRPGLFYSPYEAAVSFVIGNRISIQQRQHLMHNIARAIGHESMVDGEHYYAFPAPQILLEANVLPGVNDIKMKRLKSIAKAAVQGWLTRAHLLSMPAEMALEQIKQLDGVGEFYAQAILYRGAGIVNDLTQDDLTEYALQQAYGNGKALSAASIKKITSVWEPYKMWCNVLMHIWLRHEIGLPQKRSFVQKPKKQKA